MSVKVRLKHLRVAPRKTRLVADMIRGEKVSEAKVILKFTVNRPAKPILKLLNSAIAAAKNNFKLEESNLFVSEIKVDEGAKLKRWMPRARGMATEIQKKTSHITLVLDEIEVFKKTEKKDKEETKLENSEIVKIEKVKKLKSIKKEKNNKKTEVVKFSKVRETSQKVFRRKSI